MAGHVVDDLYEVQVVDTETDVPVPQGEIGEIGEITIRPKLSFAFNQGYFRMPEKTLDAWRNLWHHTHDAGHFDAQNRLYFVDRITDRIRRRGENISSYEVEQALNDHHDISESAVVGIKIEGAGGEDEVKACIITNGGKAIDNIALLDYCAERMPRYAVPRYIEALDALPKSATGTIQKELLREAGITHQTGDRDSVSYPIKRRV